MRWGKDVAVSKVLHRSPLGPMPLPAEFVSFGDRWRQPHPGDAHAVQYWGRSWDSS